MVFNCKNCDGNMIYSPEKKSMFCPYCDSQGSQEKREDKASDIAICPSCNGELSLGEFDSTAQCPYCDSYIILDERVEGRYLPKFMIPFRLGRDTCKKAMREKFKRHTFAPVDFLSEVRLNGMKGMYVPFWFYNYKTREHFQGEGTKVRSWNSGEDRYTETSYYNVVRDADIDFEKLPADASVKMPDDIMDLMAPYNYDELEAFQPEYLSGFYAERYNMSAEAIESRARQRMEQNAKALMRTTYEGYSSVKPIHEQVETLESSSDFGLLPVWKYDYRYKGQDYPFYINGQSGKIVGTVPHSRSKVLVYSATLWALLAIIMGVIVNLAVYL
ncbi:MAG: hypothetical protein NC081_10125 [Roseburia sp.]|nr:hypothetical protein [Roseburia sp.]